jgi:hypothetical protein
MEFLRAEKQNRSTKITKRHEFLIRVISCAFVDRLKSLHKGARVQLEKLVG